jgi:hypothetical protein
MIIPIEAVGISIEPNEEVRISIRVEIGPGVGERSRGSEKIGLPAVEGRDLRGRGLGASSQDDEG